MYNHKEMVTGVALKRLILEWLSSRILEQIHTIDLTRKAYVEIIDITTEVRRIAEK
jgi:hypothetical protein